MAQPRALYVGPRIKRLRRELGLSQASMADDLDISASYIALIERNQRPLTADLLVRLARTYDLDVADLADDDSEEYRRRVAEVLRDPIFGDIEMPAMEVADLAANFPGISEALLRLHGAYVREQHALAGQGERGGDDGEVDPIAEARRFIAGRKNHFPVLDTDAEELAAEIAKAGSAAEWLRLKGVRVRFLPDEVLAGSLRRFDRHNQQLLIADSLDGASRSFQTALHVAYTAMRGQIAAILKEGEFSGPTAENLVRRALGGYAAAAILMPYAKFAAAVEQRRYDVEALGRQFGTSFEQIGHRLTTLQRPGSERVPFFFIRVDEAGNVSKRLDGAGFPFAAFGGSCPLWNVHATFRRPGEVVTQWLELPGGERFFSIARTVVAGGGRHGNPRLYRSVALACSAEHAPKLVYAQGIDPAQADATPIGIACRICHRSACTARAVPPIGREVLPEDYRRAAEPFAFDE